MTSYAHMSAEERATSTGGWLRATLSIESLSLAQAFAMKTDPDVTAPFLLQYAVWLEDAALLDTACRECIGTGGRVPAQTLEAAQAKALLAVLKKGDKSGVEEVLGRVDRDTASFAELHSRFLTLKFGTQLARAAGKNSQASRLWRDAAAALAKLPADINIEVWHLATHWRDALKLGIEQQKARAFFANLAKRGYNCYTALA
jgi:hypothetical protein